MIRNDLYQRITDLVVAQLEKGVAPWQQPWVANGGGLPKNVVSRKPYRGHQHYALVGHRRRTRLRIASLGKPTAQWDMLGGHVNRGEHGTKIIFWNVVNQTVIDQNTGDEKTDKRFFLREYTVFNLDQCGGEALDRFRAPVRPPREFTDFQPAEEAIAATGADIRHGGNRAYFNTLHDYIQLPAKGAFDSEGNYYCAALHRTLPLDWPRTTPQANQTELARFGDKSYATEELVAELAGAFLAAALEIPNERTLDNATAYLAHWLEVLKSDSKAIFTVATAASAAADYILTFSRGVETEEQPEAVVA